MVGDTGGMLRLACLWWRVMVEQGNAELNRYLSWALMQGIGLV